MKPQTAIKPRKGRPPVLKDGRRIELYLDAQSIEAAAKLGDGNVSEGIRRALKQMSPA